MTVRPQDRPSETPERRPAREGDVQRVLDIPDRLPYDGRVAEPRAGSLRLPESTRSGAGSSLNS